MTGCGNLEEEQQPLGDGDLMQKSQVVFCASAPHALKWHLHGMQAGRVMMRLWASFLNNSSSRWEPIWENWPLHMEIMDIVSPIYRSDFQRQASLSFLEPLLDAIDFFQCLLCMSIGCLFLSSVECARAVHTLCNLGCHSLPHKPTNIVEPGSPLLMMISIASELPTSQLKCVYVKCHLRAESTETTLCILWLLVCHLWAA